MAIESLPTFTKPARQRWESIPAFRAAGDQTATIKKLLLITSNPQLDELFAATSK